MRWLGGAALTVVVAPWISSCERATEEAWHPPPVVQAAIDAGTLPTVEESASWIAFYDPKRSMNGYTVGFYRRRIPIVFDMNGRIVHAWPEVRAKSRARLLPNGNLLTLDLGRSVSEWSWGGERVWTFKDTTRTPHHDLIRLTNGNTMVVSIKRGEPAGELLEIDSRGEIAWEWKATEHLAAYLDRAGSKTHDLTHINSVQELPDNRHFDGGDLRFRPGNLLISARNLSTIFVLDRDTSEVVWEYGAAPGGELDLQHEALMIQAGWPGEGNIVLFDNGYRNRVRYRSTEVLEIDPSTSEALWSYSDPTFFSPTAGLEQPLHNGNLLVSSSRGGRAFELTRDHEPVWQWTPPYEPRRPQRVPYDFTPELAAMQRPREVPVRRPAGYLWVDRDVYRFVRRGQLSKLDIAGSERRVLTEPNQCHTMLLPAEARVDFALGIRSQPTETSSSEPLESATRARFTLKLRSEPTEIILFEEHAELPGQDIWSERSIDLAGNLAGKKVELCVETGWTDDTNARTATAHWSNLFVSTGQEPSEDSDAPTDLTPEELAAQQEHLRTLGYVD